MTIEQIIKDLQENCDSFIRENSESIITSIEQNQIIITSPFPEYKIKELSINSWGVYVFYVKFKNTVSTFEELNNLWQTNLADRRLHSPKAIKGRFQPIIENKWYCFYIGKSENLNGRVSQHIHQLTAYTTYGLKISEHDRLLENADFAYSTYVISENPLNNKDGLKCIIVTLERYLRNKLQPLIGKQ